MGLSVGGGGSVLLAKYVDVLPARHLLPLLDAQFVGDVVKPLHLVQERRYRQVSELLMYENICFRPIFVGQNKRNMYTILTVDGAEIFLRESLQHVQIGRRVLRCLNGCELAHTGNLKRKQSRLWRSTTKDGRHSRYI